MWPLTPLNQALSIAILLLSLALGASMLHGRALKAERDEARMTIKTLTEAAKTYEDQSVITAKETSDAFTLLVEQIKTKNTALNAARTRFGTCNVAGGITAVRLPNMPASASEAGLPESAGGVQEPELIPVDRAFIEGCASDSAFVGAVHTWRIANQLPISKE